ncbi:MAG: ATP-binding protein, partial [Gaiellaceae bacterium]
AHLLRDLQAEVAAMAHDGRHATGIREIANTSGIVAPLAARGRTLGVISLGTVGAQPRFDESDVEWAMELARRISLALDNARLFGEAQERAHAAEALEYVDDGVFLVDESAVVRLWNPTAALSLRRPASEAVGRPIAELLPDWSSLESRIPVASEPQPGRSRAQALPVDVQGEERWLAISAVRFPGGTVYAFRDVTDERAVEQMKTDFVSTVSHELRTPLTSIYGFAETLLRHDVLFGDEERATFLGYIASESQRLTQIVDALLNVARLDTGDLQVRISDTDVREVLGDVVQTVEHGVPNGHSFVVDLPDEPVPAKADPEKLRQVFAILLDNAIRYSPTGGTVRVGAERKGETVEMIVVDQGVGIPLSDQEQIFRKFYRGADADARVGAGGTGLGLFIARGLVTAMGGRISVSSREGEGSTFAVELPIGTGA